MFPRVVPPMLSRLLDQLHHETPIAVHVSRRDLPSNLAGFGVGCGVAWLAHPSPVLLWLIVAVLVCEGVGIGLAQFMPPRAAQRMSVVFALVHMLATAVYLGPALLLAGQPSVALMLVGFIYLFGVSVHVSNTFAALPVYNVLHLVPVMLGTGAVMVLAQGQTYATSPDLHWLAAIFTLLIYAGNTLGAIYKQKDTRAQLESARADAQARLQALEHMTRHDSLTGLLNRQAFDSGLAQMIGRQREGSHLGVFLIDLDGFKPVNDTYGHAAGDAVLTAVAARLQAAAGEGGLAARLGGDEFAVALPGLPSGPAAMQFAQVLVREISQPVPWAQKSLEVSASIGVGLSGVAGASVADLCVAADQAMYRAKGSPLRTMMFQPGAFPRRLTLDDRRLMAQALAEGRFRPHYQPKVRLADAGLIGLEAVARWDHPDRGLLTPDHFLDTLHQLGLQGDYMAATLAQVLADVEQMLAQGHSPGEVSVNMPEVALATQAGRAELLGLVTSHPQAARHLTIEITEDVFIARSADAIRSAVADLRDRGLRISLDNFGTGFASFQHLRQLQFDEIKIGAPFVTDLGRDPAAEVLVKGTLDIAAGLRVQVVAEGIETEAQRQTLIALGASLGQGALFGRALPLAETMLRMTTERMRVPFEPLVPPRSRQTSDRGGRATAV